MRFWKRWVVLSTGLAIISMIGAKNAAADSLKAKGATMTPGEAGHHYGPDYPKATYVKHALEEKSFDTGEFVMNYATAGSPDSPALLLIPGQTESWWGYEAAMQRLKEHFQVYAVDLRGQGRSTRTPGRYTLDDMGNDLVRFILLEIKRPVVVSGLSSGGLVATWLAAYAPPGWIRGAFLEDPPYFSSEVDPAYGPSIHQSIGPMFALWSKYLGDQWTIGDWKGMQAAAPRELPGWMLMLRPGGNEPPQTLKEYDPEWGRSFIEGKFSASCDHERMLKAVKVPVIYTQHFRRTDEKTGHLMGAASDLQAERVKVILSATGHGFEYQSHPTMGHAMHSQDPELYVGILTKWAATLGNEGE